MYKKHKPVHKMLNLLALSVFSLAFIYGCGTKERTDFPMTIVVSEKLGNTADATLPEYIIPLAMPIETCEKALPVPEITLFRLGYPSSKTTIDNNIKSSFAGNKNNPKLIRRNLTEKLATMEIGQPFAVDILIDPQAELRAMLNELGEDATVIFYFRSGKTDHDYQGVTTVSALAGVKKALAATVCGTELSPLYIFIDPPVKNNTISKRASNDPIIVQIDAENEKLKTIKDKKVKRAQADHLEKLIRANQDPSDYRFVYELVKNRIYGEEHHEAFELLEQAARIAITNGEARYLLDRIKGDQNTVLRKLSRGHGKKWNNILHALEENDIDKLGGHQEGQKVAHNK